MITLNVHGFDPDCATDAVPFFSLPISTNAAGNGHTKAPTIPPEAVAGLAGEHGVNWIVEDEQGTAGLVDELALFVWPVILGGRNLALPNDTRADLELIDEHRFNSGVVHLRYRLQ